MVNHIQEQLIFLLFLIVCFTISARAYSEYATLTTTPHTIIDTT